MSPETKDAAVAVLFLMIFAVIVFVLIRSTVKRSVPDDDATPKHARIRIDTRDNPGLLIAAMRAFEGTGEVSFQGIGPGLDVLRLPGATQTETLALRGSILWPRIPLVTLPLTHENIEAIAKLTSWESSDAFLSDPGDEKDDRVYPANFIHVQIASNGRCVFGAWDEFHPDCVVATDEFPLEVLDRLTADGTIRGYTIDPYPYRGTYFHAP